MTDRRLPGAAILAGGGDNHNQKERPLVVAACSQAIAFLFGMSLDHEQERLMDSSNITNQDIEREAKSPQVPYGTMNNRQTNNHGDSVATAATQPSANALSSTRAQHSQEYPETVMNLSLFDPPRWGWTAVGGVADVLTPHEVRDCVFLNRYSLSFFSHVSPSLPTCIHFAEITETEHMFVVQERISTTSTSFQRGIQRFLSNVPETEQF
jgi:hypothetical protein